MLGRLMCACAVAIVALAASIGDETPIASATTGVEPLWKVSVRITDNRIIVHPKRIERGVTVWFRVVNKGKKKHNFVVSGLKTKPLGPGQVDHIVMSFDDRGAYLYRCNLNCNARVMRGRVVVHSLIGG